MKEVRVGTNSTEQFRDQIQQTYDQKEMLFQLLMARYISPMFGVKKISHGVYFVGVGHVEKDEKWWRRQSRELLGKIKPRDLPKMQPISISLM